MRKISLVCIIGSMAAAACSAGGGPEPTATVRQGLATALDVRFAAFIPCDAVSMPLLPVSNNIFEGDNRSFDLASSMTASRAAIEATIDANNPLASYTPFIGQSYSFLNTEATQNAPSASDPEGQCYTLVRDNDGNLPGFTTTGQADPSTVSVTEISRGPDPNDPGRSTIIQTRFSIHSSIPLVPLAPAIDADIDLFVKTLDFSDGSVVMAYWLSGSHDGFPNFEMYVNDTLAYSADNVALGHTPWYLAGDPFYPQTQVSTDPVFLFETPEPFPPNPPGGWGLGPGL